jgi:hypothetical protein
VYAPEWIVPRMLYATSHSEWNLKQVFSFSWGASRNGWQQYIFYYNSFIFNNRVTWGYNDTSFSTLIRHVITSFFILVKIFKQVEISGKSYNVLFKSFLCQLWFIYQFSNYFFITFWLREKFWKQVLIICM